MINEEIFTYLKDFVDSKYTKDVKKCNDDVSSIGEEFLKKVREEISDEDFGKLIMAVYIPDLYLENGSKEKLYTKLVEILVAEWAHRLGLNYEIITKKSGVEDIRIFITKKVVVSDVKTFRLGRSQGAPNVKDFLKLESVKHWMDKCKEEGHEVIGGLITYTSLHEWKRNSEVYIQCSSKSTPTVMLPYSLLSYMLHYKNNISPQDLIALWEFKRLFPSQLPEANNKELYWGVIIPEILKITKTSIKDHIKFEEKFVDPFTRELISFNKKHLTEEIYTIKKSTRTQIDNMPEEEVKEEYYKYAIKTKMEGINKVLKYIEKHR